MLHITLQRRASVLHNIQNHLATQGLIAALDIYFCGDAGTRPMVKQIGEMKSLFGTLFRCDELEVFLQLWSDSGDDPVVSDLGYEFVLSVGDLDGAHTFVGDLGFVQRDEVLARPECGNVVGG